ncbi:DegT/DnrJ/EryC1/StrS family aminotransferase [Algibacter amylolyticus]|uniref:DegT/DnrJ/EryC1/StrS family aminotransferase n=1 Tax=Algibacter amylolyticus TaxID=1608400 RepID=A0A5M7B3N6_9FLAO|nr:DegT/DnrJ/EryC1/StrS family aminotransferase [Algibacter amylolyticus]KAA5824052.1 DegT/DnrJ/EryC1/StrS family aminotransferase [Algibacter amylolyticus]MBB5269605.1 dTDP-4-amino-4,6-dideoxygalactose transaminase [Algibacter amylolyticus]TSJ74529.1 DegT/DnrJ/EryC1/StrS family aminotransferase [Algibacter amylolyticus]
MIKFLDLNAVNAKYEDAFKNVFNNFLKTGQYILGEQVSKFEDEFSAYCGTSYCIGVGSGLDALKLIFEAFKLQGKLAVGDEVLVPANTFIASVLAISESGLKPILVEPNIDTYNIDTGGIEAYITSKTKAILGVHLYGNLFDVESLEEISKKHNLLLIEDAAQAHGAVFKNLRRAGNLSTIAAFSFYPTKNLGALGDAGAITTNDKELHEIIKRLRSYGGLNVYQNDFKGCNSRLDEMQAAFLRIKLSDLDNINKQKQELANYFLEHIMSKQIVLPKKCNSGQQVYHQFVIRCKNRDKLKGYLLEHGIQTMIHYPVPIHKQKCFTEFNDLELPITENICNTVLSLPFYTTLTQAEINKIVSTLNNFN